MAVGGRVLEMVTLVQVATLPPDKTPYCIPYVSALFTADTETRNCPVFPCSIRITRGWSNCAGEACAVALSPKPDETKVAGSLPDGPLIGDVTPENTTPVEIVPFSNV